MMADALCTGRIATSVGVESGALDQATHYSEGTVGRDAMMAAARWMGRIATSAGVGWR